MENDNKIVKEQQETIMALLQDVVKNEGLYDENVYSTVVMSLTTISKELNTTRIKLITGNLKDLNEEL